MERKIITTLLVVPSLSAVVGIAAIMATPKAADAALSCQQCDEMFQECISEVDPDAPAAYEACQIVWDHCKKNCS